MLNIQKYMRLNQVKELLEKSFNAMISRQRKDMLANNFMIFKNIKKSQINGKNLEKFLEKIFKPQFFQEQ